MTGTCGSVSGNPTGTAFLRHPSWCKVKSFKGHRHDVQRRGERRPGLSVEARTTANIATQVFAFPFLSFSFLFVPLLSSPLLASPSLSFAFLSCVLHLAIMTAQYLPAGITLQFTRFRNESSTLYHDNPRQGHGPTQSATSFSSPLRVTASTKYPDFRSRALENKKMSVPGLPLQGQNRFSVKYEWPWHLFI